MGDGEVKSVVVKLTLEQANFLRQVLEVAPISGNRQQVTKVVWRLNEIIARVDEAMAEYS